MIFQDLIKTWHQEKVDIKVEFSRKGRYYAGKSCLTAYPSVYSVSGFEWEIKENMDVSKTKEKAFFLIILILVVGVSHASILDQSQEQTTGGWLVVCSEWSFAQTFTAGLTGQLEKVDVYLENMTEILESRLYPSTFSIVNTIDGVPSGSVLGTVYEDNLVEGFNSINFMPKSVTLTADTQYGIVISNDDPDKYNGISTQW